MAKVLSHAKIESMFQSPSLKRMGMQMANQYIWEIGAHASLHEILEAYGQTNVSTAGYTEVYKKIVGDLIIYKGTRVQRTSGNLWVLYFLAKSYDTISF